MFVASALGQDSVWSEFVISVTWSSPANLPTLVVAEEKMRPFVCLIET